jgi:aspartyl aminopeptidase
MKSIQIMRKKANLTQESVASILGVSQQAYANYEKDDVEVSRKVLEKLANVFMCNVDDFLFVDKLENDSITEFLYKSLTSYHAVKNTKELLLANGYQELLENENWVLEKGKSYFVGKNESALIAFKVGDIDSHYAFNIASCHTDSPSLKIKGNCLLTSPEGKRINVERYGGLINYSFMDIPLRIAGRALVETNEGVTQQIITSDFNVNIPSLCIHHNPSVNEGVNFTVQNDMLPLIGEVEDLYKALLPNEEIIDADLYCVPFVKPTYSGINNDLLVSPRIDNLSSLYAITHALLNSNSCGVSVLYATDNEEIGSLSKQGAESIFLTHVLERINQALGKNSDDYYKALTNGFVLSIDNGHAVHPAHPEKSDPKLQVVLNGGVVIKHHPNYSTDGVSSAVIKSICSKNNIKYQEYYNNSNVRCGSTIGLVTSSQLAINTCDIGLAQLAMHSGIETVGKYDIQTMINLVKAFFETKLIISGSDIKIQ